MSIIAHRLLNNNKLESLPNTLDNLCNLQVMFAPPRAAPLLFSSDIGNNVLESLPSTFGKMSSIKTITACKNKFQILDGNSCEKTGSKDKNCWSLPTVEYLFAL